MEYHSHLDCSVRANFQQAVEQGLAPDGGLYVPDYFPKRLARFQDNYSAFAHDCLRDYFEGGVLAEQYESICHAAFNFPIPIVRMDDRLSVLELFHGPTASFKDVGARHLAQVFSHLPCAQKRLILVATSGDTGSAVASAFFQQPDVQVVVMYPDGMVSDRQAHQISCWGHNVLTLSLEGDFDDCQHLLKSVMHDESVQSVFHLTTANSINIGRLLPQVAYFAYASLYHQLHLGTAPLNFIVPSGNVGNATAAYWARKMGYPIGDIVLAQNSNRTVVDYLQTGVYAARETQETIANAMDVGNPSNFSRLQYLYPDYNDFKKNVEADWVSDEAIRLAITAAYLDHGVVMCPHTAAAYAVAQRRCDQMWMLVATAHPAKFESVVEPLLDFSVTMPELMRAQLARPKKSISLMPDKQHLLQLIVDWQKMSMGLS